MEEEPWSKPLYQQPSAYSKFSTRDGTLKLYEGEVEENVFEDECFQTNQVSSKPHTFNKKEVSNLTTKTQTFDSPICSKTLLDDDFGPIDEVDEEPNYVIEERINGVIKKKYIWNFD